MVNLLRNRKVGPIGRSTGPLISSIDLLRPHATDSLLNFFGITDHPFSSTPNPQFFYESATHTAALKSLAGGIESGAGFQALIARPGMGKTTLITKLLERFRSSSTAFLFQTQCDSREFLQYLLKDFRVQFSPGDGIVDLHNRLSEFLVAQRSRRRAVLLIVDEAQNLDTPVLETIRLLSNIETFSYKLIQILLVGQTQLAQRLLAPELLQLRQRIPLIAKLETLGESDVKAYIQHRFRVAGLSGEAIFTEEAIQVISRSSSGVPRNINTICSNTLTLGFASKKRILTGATVCQAIGDLDTALHFIADTEPFIQPIAPRRNEIESLELHDIACQIQVATGASGTAIAVAGLDGMICCARAGTVAPALGALVDIRQGLTGESIRRRKLLVCNDTKANRRIDTRACTAQDIRSMAILPLLSGRKVVGIVGMFSDRTNAFNRPELETLKTMAAACCRNGFKSPVC
jgi:type II secretory pathway predicted ATPase ExeA